MERLEPPPGLEFRVHLPSFGHPEMCSRPCVYMFRRGHCRLGLQCSFCHEPHDVAPYKMRPRLRRLFAHLPREQQMFVVLAHLGQRSAQPGFPAEAAALVQCLKSEWEEAQKNWQVRSIRLHLSVGDLRDMQRAFWRMPLYAVVTHFPHSSPGLLHSIIEQVRWNIAAGESISRFISANFVSCHRLSV